MFNRLIRRPVFLAAVAALVVLPLAWWFAWMAPEAHRLAAARTQQATDRLDKSELQLQLAQLVKEQSEVKAQSNYPGDFAAAIPPTPDAPGLVVQVYNLAQSTGVTLQSISDNTVKSDSARYSSIPVSIDVQGGHNSVLSFVSGLYQLPRLVTIQSLSLDGSAPVNSSSNSQYTASILATAYTTAVSATTKTS